MTGVLRVRACGVLFAAVSYAAMACNTVPATEVIVSIGAQASLRPRAAKLHVLVRNHEGATVLERDKALSGGALELACIPVVPKDGDASRRFDVEAELFDARDSRIGRLRATLRFHPDELREAHLTFDAECESVTGCGAGRTCVDGVCVGSCFEAAALDDTPHARSRPLCHACEQCAAGSCEPIPDGSACGCEGDVCRSGRCVVAGPARAVAAGTAHTCATTEQNKAIYCWGANDRSQLGRDASDGPSPEPALAYTSAAAMAYLGAFDVGRDTTCILVGAGSDRICWGFAFGGEFGDGTEGDPARLPTRIPGSTAYSAISVGTHVCARASSGALECWGYNAHGQLGRGTTSEHENRPAPVGDARDWQLVSAGGLFTCGIKRDGSLWCWGYNEDGELGIGDHDPHLELVRPGCAATRSDGCTSDYRDVSVGTFHACAIRENGELRCWGGNSNGQLGIGSVATNEDEPKVVAAGKRWSRVSAGYRNTCAIADDGALWCWGPGAVGEIGDGARELRSTPTLVADPVSDGERWLDVTVGGGYDERLDRPVHVCAIRSDGSIWCWGRNEAGQTGARDRLTEGVELPHRVCLPPDPT